LHTGHEGARLRRHLTGSPPAPRRRAPLDVATPPARGVLEPAAGVERLPDGRFRGAVDALDLVALAVRPGPGVPQRRVQRRLVAHDHVLAGERQLKAHPNVLPASPMAVRPRHQHPAPHDVGVEGLQPCRAAVDEIGERPARTQVAERDTNGPDHLPLRPLWPVRGHDTALLDGAGPVRGGRTRIGDAQRPGAGPAPPTVRGNPRARWKVETPGRGGGAIEENSGSRGLFRSQLPSDGDLQLAPVLLMKMSRMVQGAPASRSARL
jgi:hypothetical protein